MGVRIASQPLGWAAARRALAGVPVGGPAEARLRRWAATLLGAPGGPATRRQAASRLRAATGQVLPAVVGAVAILLIAALAIVSIAGALTGKGRLQRSADLAALSAARSMRDDMPRVTAPPRLPNGAPNPAHIDRALYLARARDRASVKVEGGRVTVRLRPPSPLGFLSGRLALDSSAWVRPPR